MQLENDFIRAGEGGRDESHGFPAAACERGAERDGGDGGVVVETAEENQSIGGRGVNYGCGGCHVRVPCVPIV